MLVGWLTLATRIAEEESASCLQLPVMLSMYIQLTPVML